MPVISDAPAALYTQAWIGLLFIFGVIVLAGVALRWRPHRPTEVTRYEPPKEISPAIAAFLIEGGRCERSFAAAIISLGAKGYIKIAQNADSTTLSRLREADGQLSPEESAVLASLFPGILPSYSFDGRDYSRLTRSYAEFQDVVEGIATPELISSHLTIWLVGLACSCVVLLPILASQLSQENGTSLASLGYFSIWIFVGGSCFVAALRVWPATLRKLASLFPGTRHPKRALDLNDAIPVFLTVSAVVGFAFLGVLTSPQFAGLVASVIALNLASRRLLDAPTRAGRRVLPELRGFREFLSRADADRLDHENQPGKSPNALERYTPYAVALGVERGWGEEFAGNLLQLLLLDKAYSSHTDFLKVDNQGTELKILNRKK